MNATLIHQALGALANIAYALLMLKVVFRKAFEKWIKPNPTQTNIIIFMFMFISVFAFGLYGINWYFFFAK